jgi:hypothetical protein
LGSLILGRSGEETTARGSFDWSGAAAGQGEQRSVTLRAVSGKP